MTEPTTSSVPTTAELSAQITPFEDLDAIVAVETLASATNEDTVRQRRIREEISLDTLQPQHESIVTDTGANEPSTSADALEPQQADNYYPPMDIPFPAKKLTFFDIILICICFLCVVIIVYTLATIINFAEVY